MVVTASHDHTMKIWSMCTGDCALTLAGHSSDVRSALFSKDGSSVLTASRDNTAKIWDSYTGQRKQTLSGLSVATRPILNPSAAYSTDESSILTVSDNAAKIWDSCTGECNAHGTINRCACGCRDPMLAPTLVQEAPTLAG